MNNIFHGFMFAYLAVTMYVTATSNDPAYDVGIMMVLLGSWIAFAWLIMAFVYIIKMINCKQNKTGE